MDVQVDGPMKSGKAAVAVLIVSMFGLAGCGTTSSVGSGTSASSLVSVTISNFKFIPDTVRVKAGQDIKITNDDSVTHTFTAANGAFGTGNIPPGQSVIVQAPKVTGNVAITDPFLCTIHQFMTGKLIVTP